MFFLKEFKEFIKRGNIMDFVVVMIFIAAFSKIAIVFNLTYNKMVFDFTIILLTLFLMIKCINILHKKQTLHPGKLKKEKAVLREIEDLLHLD